MKTWIKRTLIGVAAVTALLGGMAACAGHHHHRHGGWSDEQIATWRGKAIERVSDKLKLDTAQKAKLDTLANEMLAQRQALRGAAGAEPRTQLRALIAGPSFDRAAAGQLLTEKTAAVQTQGPKVLDAIAAFYDSLKPEQQAQLREMMDKRGHGRW